MSEQKHYYCIVTYTSDGTKYIAEFEVGNTAPIKTYIEANDRNKP